VMATENISSTFVYICTQPRVMRMIQHYNSVADSERSMTGEAASQRPRVQTAGEIPSPWRPPGPCSAAGTGPPRSDPPSMPCGEESPLSGENTRGEAKSNWCHSNWLDSHWFKSNWFI